MSIGLFLILLGIGSAVIAFWVDARFPRLAPTNYQRCVLHAATAIFVGSFLTAPALRFAGTFVAAPGARLVICLVGLCILTYAFLAGVWIVRVTQALVARHMR